MLVIVHTHTQTKYNYQITGRSDEVACAFCNEVIYEWEPENIPMEDHKKFNPACPFLSGLAVNGMC